LLLLRLLKIQYVPYEGKITTTAKAVRLQKGEEETLEFDRSGFCLSSLPDVCPGAVIGTYLNIGCWTVTGFLSAATSRTAVTAGSATMGFLGGGVAEADHFDGKGE